MLDALSDEMRQKINILKYYKIPILMIFSFIFGSMLTINLTPIDKTCRIEDTDHEFNIMQNSKLKNPELIILIMSAPLHLNERNVIRQTWLKLIDTSPQNQHIKFKMKHYFVIGSLGLSGDETLHITAEQGRHSDILILPMHDSYANLTHKVLQSFEWLNEQFDYGLGFKYVLKCDDDSFLRLDRLATEISNMELMYLKSELKQVKLLARDAAPFTSIDAQVNANATRNDLQLYWGYFRGSAVIKKTGKWKESGWIACDRYAPYALGGGYILSKKLVSYIAKNAENLRMFHSEDVSVGFWLAPVNHVLRVHDIRFDTEWTTRGCQNFYLITHKVAVSDMQKMYANIQNGGGLCGIQVTKRPFYLYNWTVPPSQCCVVK